MTKFERTYFMGGPIIYFMDTIFYFACLLCSTVVPFWFVFSTPSPPPSNFILRPCYA